MSPVVRKTMGNAAILALLAALGGGAVQVYRKYGSLNPYGNLGHAHTADPMAEVTAKGVRVREYHDGKLVTQADAEKLTMAQGGNQIVLDHVKNGVSKTPQGPVSFAGGKGVLNPLTKTVEVSQGVRVKGGDFDVSSRMATLSGRTGEVNVPTPLQGTIGGGRFTAASMVHRNNTNFTRIVLPEWKGRVTAQDAPTPMKNKQWRFTGDEVTNGTDDAKRAKDPVERRLRHAVNGWATDGEMVITSPTMMEDPETGIVTATGDKAARATYHSAKADIVADKVVVYQKEHRAVCTGRVIMFVRPKADWDKPLRIDDDDRGPLVPDVPASLLAKMSGGATLSQAEKDKIGELRSSKNLRDYPMQMAAEEVTYWYQEGERRAVAKGGTPTAYQKLDDGRWRQAWAPTANYDGEKDMLDLVGSLDKREVHMKNSIGDNNDCYQAKLSTAEDNDYAWMKKPKALGTDFDADQPAGAKPGAAGKAAAATAPVKAPPAKGATGG